MLSAIDILNQQRFLLQEELYQAINLYDSLHHPNVIAISDEMDNVTMDLQRMGVVA